MKLFKPFTPESILLGLGLTAVMYIVTPVIKEFISDDRSSKKLFSYNNKNDKVIFDKSSLL